MWQRARPRRQSLQSQLCELRDWLDHGDKKPAVQPVLPPGPAALQVAFEDSAQGPGASSAHAHPGNADRTIDPGRRVLQQEAQRQLVVGGDAHARVESAPASKTL